MLKALKPVSTMTLLALIFSGCSTAPVKTTPEVVKEVPGPTRVVDNSCLYFKPITPTDDDVRVMSRALIDQISNHDKVGMQHCGWKFGSTK
jgi:PBP1b-binding outer membrane lipoprotein LpoB